MVFGVNDLPKQYPQTAAGAVLELAKQIGIPSPLVPQKNLEQVTVALAGLVLYRHVGEVEKRQILESFEHFSQSDRRFYGLLHTKLANVLVNPKWEIWSLSATELQEIIRFHKSIGLPGDLGGKINPGPAGVAGSLWSLVKNGATKLNVGALVTSLVLTAFWTVNNTEIERAQTELENRQVRQPANPNARFQ